MRRVRSSRLPDNKQSLALHLTACVFLQALYENMLVELPFASFFLSKLLGTSADVDIHHLASLDPEMYRNLLFLKSYEDDVEELGLNFTVVNNDLGEAQVSLAAFRPQANPDSNQDSFSNLIFPRGLWRCRRWTTDSLASPFFFFFFHLSLSLGRLPLPFPPAPPRWR